VSAHVGSEIAKEVVEAEKATNAHHRAKAAFGWVEGAARLSRGDLTR